MTNQYKDIVEFAIEREEDAYNFYTQARKIAKTSNAKTIFDQLAKQELRHKEKLEAIKLSSELLMDLSTLNIDDYKNDESFTPDMQYHMEYQQILLLAIKRESLSVRLYTDMRQAVHEPGGQQLFDRLIKEEEAHRDTLQMEYDAYVLTED